MRERTLAGIAAATTLALASLGCNTPRTTNIIDASVNTYDTPQGKGASVSVTIFDINARVFGDANGVLGTAGPRFGGQGFVVGCYGDDPLASCEVGIEK